MFRLLAVAFVFLIFVANLFAIDQKTAKEIMGANFIGVDDRPLGICPQPGERKKLIGKIPFSREDLIKKKDSHLLIAIPKISILDMVKIDTLFIWEIDRSNQLVLSDSGEARWYLVEKFPQSKSKLEARILIYAALAYRRTSKEFIYSSVCSSDNYLIRFDPNGVFILKGDCGKKLSKK